MNALPLTFPPPHFFLERGHNTAPQAVYDCKARDASVHTTGHEARRWPGARRQRHFPDDAQERQAGGAQTLANKKYLHRSHLPKNICIVLTSHPFFNPSVSPTSLTRRGRPRMSFSRRCRSTACRWKPRRTTMSTRTAASRPTSRRTPCRRPTLDHAANIRSRRPPRAPAKLQRAKQRATTAMAAAAASDGQPRHVPPTRR